MEFEDLELQQIRSKWEQLARLTNSTRGGRSDVHALMPFLISLSEVLDGLNDIIDDRELYRSTAEVTERSFDPDYAAVELFWQTYRPVQMQLDTSAPGELGVDRLPAEPLSPHLEALMLECLDFLHKRHRVEYVPDGDDPDLYLRLSAYVHIVAARAFRIKQSDGLSEEVVGCLSEVERAIERLARETMTISIAGVQILDTSETPVFLISTGAVAVLAFMELSRDRRINRDYASALHYLAKAAIYFDETVRNNGSTLSARFDKHEHSLDSYKREARLQSLLSDRLHDRAPFRRY